MQRPERRINVTGFMAALAVPALLGVLMVGRGAVERRPNLLLVVVDTLRRDHLGLYGYSARPTSPALDAFGSEAVVVSGLTSVSPWTMPSVATMHTGLTPAQHGITGLQDTLNEERTLAAVLAASGYATACIQANLLLAAYRVGGATGFSRGFDYYDNDLTLGEDPHLGTTSAEVTRRGLMWLGEQSTEQPWFLTLHFFDPHVVYEDHDEYDFADHSYEGWVRGGLRRTDLRKMQERCGRRCRRQLTAFYDEEVRMVDDAFGDFLAALRLREDWNDTLVVFTSDHGEELAERKRIGHTVTLHGEILDLPLVVRLPGSEHAGTRVDARLPQSGFFATVLELCGVDVPPNRGGSFASVIRGDEPARDRVCPSEVDFVPGVAHFTERMAKKRSLVQDGYKIVHDLSDDEWSLYRVMPDPLGSGLLNPLERNNLAGDPAYSDPFQRMKARLLAHDWLETERE